MKTKTFRLVILLTLLTGYAVPANAISEEVKQRVKADLQDQCLHLFLDGGIFGYQSPLENFVFAVGGSKSQQYCKYVFKPIFDTWEDAEKKAIARCEMFRPQVGSPCEVYAHNNDIVYVNNYERLKKAKKLIEAGDVPAAEHALNEVKDRNLSNLTPMEIGEYEYLTGKVLINSKTEQDRAFAISYFNNSWAKNGNINGAVEEGNLRMMTGDIDNNWQSIRDAYQYFLANASDEQKSLHPEVEQNMKQTEPYYQAALAQQEEAAKEHARLGAIDAEREAKQQAILKEEQQKQAKIDAINAKREAEQQAKQERLDAIKAEREAKQQEKIRQAEAKRQAIEGDGSADDITCKSYGARPGSGGYVNCRIQLSRTKQLADEQEAARKAASDAAAQRAASDAAAQRAASDAAAKKASSDAALMLLLGGFSAYQQGKAAAYQSAPMPAYQPIPSPQPAPMTPLRSPINCTSFAIGDTVNTNCY